MNSLNARQQLRAKRGEIVTLGGVSLPTDNLPTAIQLHKVLHDSVHSPSRPRFWAPHPQVQMQTNQDSLATDSTNVGLQVSF